MGLRGFLGQKGRAAGRSAFCAIGARGVSMRRLSLPAASEDELQRVLRLQIESEFPLSPDELAWGSRPIGPPKPPANGGPARQELLVVAVKKEVLRGIRRHSGRLRRRPPFHPRGAGAGGTPSAARRLRRGAGHRAHSFGIDVF